MTPLVQEFTGDGVTRTFTVDNAIAPDTPVMVWWNGLLQNNPNDYTLSGETATFTLVPNSGDFVTIEYYSNSAPPVTVGNLISLADLLAYANVSGTTAIANLTSIANQIIAGWTQAVYWATGRSPNMLTEETLFTEEYNGSGSKVLYLLNAPIINVNAVMVSGRNIPASLQFGQAGYFVQQDKKSIALRSGSSPALPYTYGFGNCGWNFAHGRGNVQVIYTAGYDGCPPDLYQFSLEQCTAILNRRLRIDESSHMIPASGQTNYKKVVMEPGNQQFLIPYCRVAMSNIF